MLVSASDPSAVIKLSEKESRTTSEIWREGCVCQINSAKLGTHPALRGGSLPSYLHKMRRMGVGVLWANAESGFTWITCNVHSGWAWKYSPESEKKAQMPRLRYPLKRQIHKGWTCESFPMWLSVCIKVSICGQILEVQNTITAQIQACVPSLHAQHAEASWATPFLWCPSAHNVTRVAPSKRYCAVGVK